MIALKQKVVPSGKPEDVLCKLAMDEKVSKRRDLGKVLQKMSYFGSFICLFVCLFFF